VLSETDVNNLYNEIEQSIIPPSGPTIDPNRLFDINFNNSLDVDYTKDGTALVFQENEAGAVTLNENSVTINPSKYIELTTGLPEYLKLNVNHSWVVQFRAISGSFRLEMALTTSPSSINYFADLTGLHIFIENDDINATIFRSPGNALARAFAKTTGVDFIRGRCSPDCSHIQPKHLDIQVIF
jgi:hypothetical protein